jgi:S-formylglutathione hydrolase FrmB
MAFVQASFFSPVLRKAVQFWAVVPEQEGPFPALYLLHGLSDDHTIWMRRTRIEIHASRYRLAVVMPDGFRGYYTDHAAGPAYGRYILDDVLAGAERLLPLRRDRKGRCIGGLSMGGYGALRLALAHPDKFASAHSHSGACFAWDIPERRRDPEFRRIFGSRPAGSEHDLRFLLRRIKRCRLPLPRLSLDCGTEDFLLAQNRAFHAFLEARKIPHEYREHPGGHNWDYWEVHIQEALAFHARALGLKTVG